MQCAVRDVLNGKGWSADDDKTPWDSLVKRIEVK